MRRYKEDQRHEAVLRGLLKQEANRKCINCGSLGPQFVCSNFATFVCMACSGVHREFTHRVKSISMSKFSPEEIAALQSGGNQRAFDYYFKSWDLRNPFPDSRNPVKLRAFIKAVYVDKIYAVDKPPAKGEYEARRSSSTRSSFLDSLSFEERPPLPGSRHIPHQRTKSEDNANGVYSPTVRSMRDLLGDDLPPLRIEPARNLNALPVDTHRRPQISRFGSFDGSTAAPPNAAAYKRANSEGHIDFNVETTPAELSSALGLAQDSYVKADTTGWATFDSVPELASTAPQTPEGTAVSAKQVAEEFGTTPAFVFPQQHLYLPPWNYVNSIPPAPQDVFVQPMVTGVLPSQLIPATQQSASQISTNPFDLPWDSSPAVVSPSLAFPSPSLPPTEFAQPVLYPPWSEPASYLPIGTALPDPYASNFGLPVTTPSNEQSRPGNPFA